MKKGFAHIILLSAVLMVLSGCAHTEDHSRGGRERLDDQPWGGGNSDHSVPSALLEGR